MAVDNLQCWSCGKSLAGVPLPFGRRSECPHCEVFLRCCRQCNFYDTRASKSCRETSADEIVDKEQANFCDFFQHKGGLTAGGDPAAAAARAKLANVFGGAAAAKRPPGLVPDAPKGDAEAEAARKKLEALFGKSKT
ncbi:MAG TPA: hypothetical protein VF678_09180 [bacterium]